MESLRIEISKSLQYEDEDYDVKERMFQCVLQQVNNPGPMITLSLPKSAAWVGSMMNLVGPSSEGKGATFGPEHGDATWWVVKVIEAISYKGGKHNPVTIRG
jgi:hypothetical protein